MKYTYVEAEKIYAVQWALRSKDKLNNRIPCNFAIFGSKPVDFILDTIPLNKLLIKASTVKISAQYANILKKEGCDSLGCLWTAYYDRSTDKLVLCDGNHRAAGAKKAGLDCMPVMMPFNIHEQYIKGIK